jgi:hypothetical protein
LSPTAVIRLRCLAKYVANARTPYEARAGGGYFDIFFFFAFFVAMAYFLLA